MSNHWGLLAVLIAGAMSAKAQNEPPAVVSPELASALKPGMSTQAATDLLGRQPDVVSSISACGAMDRLTWEAEGIELFSKSGVVGVVAINAPKTQSAP